MFPVWLLACHNPIESANSFDVDSGTAIFSRIGSRRFVASLDAPSSLLMLKHISMDVSRAMHARWNISWPCFVAINWWSFASHPFRSLTTERTYAIRLAVTTVFWLFWASLGSSCIHETICSKLITHVSMVSCSDGILRITDGSADITNQSRTLSMSLYSRRCHGYFNDSWSICIILMLCKYNKLMSSCNI